MKNTNINITDDLRNFIHKEFYDYIGGNIDKLIDDYGKNII